jgi:hypothetical protein
MTRLDYTENARAMRAAIERDPVDAAVSAIYCLDKAQLVELRFKLREMAMRPSSLRKITLSVEFYT